MIPCNSHWCVCLSVLCCHSCVSLSMLLSEVCCDWSKLEITESSFLNASTSAPPLTRAPWIPFLSSSFNWRLSRMKPGMQMKKETERRPRVRPRYATLTVEHEKESFISVKKKKKKTTAGNYSKPKFGVNVSTTCMLWCCRSDKLRYPRTSSDPILDT